MKIRKMSFLLFYLSVICLLFISGCAGNNINQIANKQQVVMPETTVIDREMEDVMTDVFTETGLEWDEAMVNTIESSMAGLREESYYMYSIIELGSTVPYYELRATTNRTYRLVNKLKKELDARSQQPGAVTKIGKYAYGLLVEKVLLEAKRQKLNLASIDARINKSANAADLADLKKLYDTMAPLVKTAMVAL
jgi:hypothetical protein